MRTDVQGDLRMTIRTTTPKDIPSLRELYLELEKDGVRFYERNGFCEMMKTIECQTLD